jgi:hypothetical protein
MMQRAIFGLIYDYSMYDPTDAEMGITEDMKGSMAMTDLQTLGNRMLAADKKLKAAEGDPCVTIDAFVEKKREDFTLSEKIDELMEKPICYDCPSELWCGDCPDSDRCNDNSINCHDCEFEDGCQNELPAGFIKDLDKDIEVSFEVTDEPLSDIPNDVASFAGMNAPVTYPSIAEYVNPAEDPHDEAYEGDDPMYTKMDELLDEDYEDVTDKEPSAALKEANATLEVIDHPAHYAKADIPSGIECWDWYELAMTEEEFIGHMKGNVLKYVFRAGRKEDGKQDLEKARAYLKRWLSYLDGNRTVHLKGKYNDG